MSELHPVLPPSPEAEPSAPPTAAAAAGASSPSAPQDQPVQAAQSPQSPQQAVAGPSDATGTQVFSAPTETTGPEPVPDSFFEPTISDVQAHHASVVARSKRLNEAPLLTAKHRDADIAARDAKKNEKWPNATIRIKFSDGTQIQSTFPSSSAIQPVYAFVRESLAPTVREKSFTLYQPPRTMFPEKPVPAPVQKKHPNPAMKARVITPANYGPQRGLSTQGGTGGNESLSQLGLVPQSVLLVKWDDGDMNASTYVAPLNDDLKARMKPLPAPQPKEPEAGKGEAPKQAGQALEKKMPKWLQKGLMKKKT